MQRTSPHHVENIPIASESKLSQKTTASSTHFLIKRAIGLNVYKIIFHVVLKSVCEQYLITARTYVGQSL